MWRGGGRGADAADSSGPDAPQYGRLYAGGPSTSRRLYAGGACEGTTVTTGRPAGINPAARYAPRPRPRASWAPRADGFMPAGRARVPRPPLAARRG